MEQFKITNSWEREKDFNFEVYNRSHLLTFSGDQKLNNSSAPSYKGDPNMSNPEELLLSALSSCHMLTFLAVASKSKYIVDSYIDEPIAIMDKNAEGKVSITEIHLHPKIVFSGEKIPNTDELKSLHDKAHHNCFIANSIKTKVTVF